jgi:hypothetical protein
MSVALPTERPAMNAPVLRSGGDGPLTEEVLAHLQRQIASAERLLGIVLEQGAAIRARDVHTVVRLAGLLHGELSRRETIESQRGELLGRCGERLGVEPQAVTLTRLGALLDPAGFELAQRLSAQLRGLLHELQREHACNRALMRLELSFLDHLMGALALDAAPGYDPRGASAGGARSGGALRVLDLHA